MLIINWSNDQATLGRQILFFSRRTALKHTISGLCVCVCRSAWALADRGWSVGGWANLRSGRWGVYVSAVPL
jgi:hypothetical protein